MSTIAENAEKSGINVMLYAQLRGYRQIYDADARGMCEGGEMLESEFKDYIPQTFFSSGGTDEDVQKYKEFWGL